MVKVSILMAVYNEEKFICEAICSVLEQTMQDFELIIINDASTDKTEEIAKNYVEKDKSIKLINLRKHKFKAGALNKGLNIARGKYICFLDGDDIYIKDKLEHQVNYLEEHNDVDMVYGLTRIFGDKKGERNNILLEQKNLDLREILKKRAKENIENLEVGEFFGLKGVIASCSVMVRKSVFKNCKFDEKLKRTQDYDLWFQIIGKKYKIMPIKSVFYKYRMHPNQVTKNKYEMNVARDYIFKKLKAGKYFQKANLKNTDKLKSIW